MSMILPWSGRKLVLGRVEGILLLLCIRHHYTYSTWADIQCICDVKILLGRLWVKKILKAFLGGNNEKTYRNTSLDEGSWEQPIELRQRGKRDSTDSKRKTGCHFQERLVLLRNDLLFSREFPKKVSAKPSFIECENPARSRRLLKRALFWSLAWETLLLSKFDSTGNLCPLTPGPWVCFSLNWIS